MFSSLLLWLLPPRDFLFALPPLSVFVRCRLPAAMVEEHSSRTCLQPMHWAMNKTSCLMCVVTAATEDGHYLVTVDELM